MTADPQYLLRDVYWSFEGGVLPNVESLSHAVSEQMADSDAPGDAWEPDRIVLTRRSVRIKYFGVVTPDSAEYEENLVVELTAVGGTGFTAAELLFQLHNAVVDHMQDADHRYFEGLTLITPGSDTDPPLYEMEQGS